MRDERIVIGCDARERAPVRIDAPPQVALFTYDNGAFIVENYRDEPASVTISVAGAPSALLEVTQRQWLAPAFEPSPTRRVEARRRSFATEIPPHSFRVFKLEPQARERARQ